MSTWRTVDWSAIKGFQPNTLVEVYDEDQWYVVMRGDSNDFVNVGFRICMNRGDELPYLQTDEI